MSTRKSATRVRVRLRSYRKVHTTVKTRCRLMDNYRQDRISNRALIGNRINWHWLAPLPCLEWSLRPFWVFTVWRHTGSKFFRHVVSYSKMVERIELVFRVAFAISVSDGNLGPLNLLLNSELCQFLALSSLLAMCVWPWPTELPTSFTTVYRHCRRRRRQSDGL